MPQLQLQAGVRDDRDHGVGPLHETDRVLEGRAHEVRVLVVGAGEAVGVDVRDRGVALVALRDGEGRAGHRPPTPRAGPRPARGWSCPCPARRGGARCRPARGSSRDGRRARRCRRAPALPGEAAAAQALRRGRAARRTARAGSGARGAGAAPTAASSGTSGAGAPGPAAEQARDAGEVGLEGGEHRARVERRRRVEERVEQHRLAGDDQRQLVPVDAGDPVGPARQQLGREVAERADQRRADQRDLAEQVRLARADLGGQRSRLPGGRHLRTLAMKTSSA